MHTRSLAVLPVALLLACTPSDSAAEEDDGELAAVGVTADDTHVLTLTCFPEGGSHPDPHTACTSLEEADGDLDEIPPLSLVCPEVYDPVWVTVAGSWGGEEFHGSYGFPNLCAAKSDTGGVLDFV